MPALRRQSNGAARRGATQEWPASEGGPYKGKSEDGDVKSPLQNGKMRNEEEKSRSLATRGMTQAGSDERVARLRRRPLHRRKRGCLAEARRYETERAGLWKS